MAVDMFGNPVNANFVSPQDQGSGPAKKKPNFLQSLFPSIGGLIGGAGGGAAGGALAGTAILPGVGTAVGGLLGALLGGGAGGAIGKVAENKALGDSAGHDVLKEGLVQGALSAGPLRLLKGASAGGRALLAGGEALGADAAGQAAAEGGGRLVNALNAAGDAASGPGILSRTKSLVGDKGAQMEARAGGFGVGEKVAGTPALGYYDSAHVGDVLKSEGIKPGAPESRLKQLEDVLNNRGQQIDTHLAANNTTLAPAAKSAITGDFMNSIEQQPAVNDLVRKSAENYAKNFESQVGDAQGMVKFRRGLDQQAIAFNRNPDAKMAADQIAARTFRNVLTDATDQVAPGMTNLNHSYADLMHAKEFLVGGSKAVSDQSQSAGGGVIGRLLSSDTSQAAKSRLGSALKTVGQGAETASPFGLKAVAGRTLPPGLLGALSNQAVNTNSMNSPSSIKNTDISSPLSTNDPQTSIGSTPGTDTTTGSTSPFDLTNVEQNAQNIIAHGGKLSDVAQYVSLVDAMNKLKTPTSQKLSSTQVGQANNAVSGLSDLQTISRQIQADPNILKKASIPGGPTARNLTGTTDFEASKKNVVDVIARLRSGAAISANEQKTYMSLLPGYADTQESALNKLQRLQSLLGRFADPQAAAQPDLASLGLQ